MRIKIAVSIAALGASLWSPAVHDAAAVAALRVDYNAPELSVEATDVGLLDVLNAIGAKVGFTVAQSRELSTSVSISVESASVEDVLRRLLRTENHTILYRQGRDAAVEVDRIVLLGPAEGGPLPEPAVAALPPSPGSPAVSASPSAPPAVPRDLTPAAVTSPAAGVIPAAAPAPTSESDEPVTVGDMLRSHALAGVPPQASPDAEPAAPRLPASLEETLAITTRRAQQGLTSLVEGLEKATQALQQQSIAPPPAGR